MQRYQVVLCPSGTSPGARYNEYIGIQHKILDHHVVVSLCDIYGWRSQQISSSVPL
jgi:hypothetical protein